MKFRVSSAVFGCVDLRDREIPLQSTIQQPSDFSQAIRLAELRTPKIVENVSMARQEISVEQ